MPQLFADRLSAANLRVARRALAGVLLVAVAFHGASAQEPPRLLTLSSAIERAAASAPQVLSSRAGVDAAAGAELQTHLLPNPQAAIELENFGGTRGYGGLGESETTISASQLVELGGKRGARQNAASALKQAAEYEFSSAYLDMVRDITIAYVDAVVSSQILKNATDLERTAKSVLSDVSRRVSAARDPLYQQSRAQVAYTNASIARQRAFVTDLAARKKLARFWGAETTAETLSDDALLVGTAPAEFSALAERMRKNPDLAKYESRVAAREAELELARAGAIPDLTVSAGVRRFSASGGTAFLVGLSLPIPIFNQNQGEIARAGAEVRRAAFDRDQAELDRSKELIDSWADWESSWHEANELNNKSIPDAERAYQQVLAGFRAGAFQFLDVLDTQRTLFETRAAYISALARLQTSRAHVERMTATQNEPLEAKQ